MDKMCKDMFKLLIPAARAKFHVKMTIHHLSNVPLVSGQVFIKWHLKDSVRMRDRGRSPKVPIKDHKVVWDYEFSYFLSMKIGKHQRLSESWIILEVNQELRCASHQLVLGKVDINLSDYVGLSKETESYLLQNSKVNSLLKVSISMEQIGGSTNYIVDPPQKKQMFYGIADLMSKHNSETQKKDYLNDIDFEKSKDSEFLIYKDDIINKPYLFDTFHSFEIIESIFSGRDKLTKSYTISNERQYEDNDDRENGFASIKDTLNSDEKEIKIAQDWETKELEYGVCWSLNKNINHTNLQ
ncbi:hypothetical protein PORY_000083 [Pneumocystis oryctolagi]|uniref:Uncharacterized protein n=1 Tax=Pneumocystis oryctolagi TaxID=42067 RepID=A0ACB7CEZ7_9ASCO|nr:hypothetical protein PORY_000083 [Pneumocystis oryctolagi]